MAQTLLFEPSPIAYRLLLKNLAINGLERRALAFDSALSDNRAERVPFAENNYPDRSMDGLLYTQRSKGFNQILVTQETLDSAADKANLSRMDLIKIDCEGAELLVLRGARRAVERFRPIVVIEYSQLNYSKYGLCAMDLWNWAVEAGYFLFTERLDLVDERTLEIRIGAAAEREFILIPEAHRWQGI